jgi:hypothetical protein
MTGRAITLPAPLPRSLARLEPHLRVSWRRGPKKGLHLALQVAIEEGQQVSAGRAQGAAAVMVPSTPLILNTGENRAA